MTSEDGESFIKNLAQFIRTHERALANALQIQQQRAKQASSARASGATSSSKPSGTVIAPSSLPSTSLAQALSLASFGFGSTGIKPAKLTLTPHHLFYLLSRFEELGVDVGAMNIRLENLNSESSAGNYVSFLSQPQRSRGRSDRDSIHSVSSVRSVMSSFTSFWSSIGLGSGDDQARIEKLEALMLADLKYLYSAFTKIPCLRLSPDRKARLIKGYEEFPFDSAVPLIAFKNVSALEICDLDFRSFFGWDRLADQLRSLTVKRGSVEDPLDLIVHVVLDDMDKRRRRSSKTHSPSTPIWPSSPAPRITDYSKSGSLPGSPLVNDGILGSSSSPRNSTFFRGESESAITRTDRRVRDKSSSPARTGSGRPGSSYRHLKTGGEKMKRTTSGSSDSSSASHQSNSHHSHPHHSHSRSRSRSSSNLLSMGILPSSKWRFLRHLSLADNGLTSLTPGGLSPLVPSLHSLDLSSNLFTEIPDCLAILTSLRALDLSNCMIDSLHSLARSPLPAISVLNLRGNRLSDLAGIERIFSLERLDVRENRLSDPTEIARLTGIPDMRDIWVRGNPFVRSHSNYRLTIFNLFRGSPGYSEDVIVDSCGPKYNERRHLRERATEGVADAGVAPTTVDFEIIPPVEAKRPSAEEEVRDNLPSAVRPQLQATQSDVTGTSTRRKRITKRRIVDLSAEDMPESQPRNVDKPITRPTISAFTTPVQVVPSTDTALNSRPQQLQTDEDDPFGLKLTDSGNSASVPRATSVPPLKPPVEGRRLPDLDGATINPPQTMDLTGDAYRQKVQALKHEFGSSWLRVLTEQGWDAPPEDPASGLALGVAPPSAVHPPVPAMRAASQGIVGGSRTLG